MGIGISMAEKQLFASFAGNCGNRSWVYHPVDWPGGRFLDDRCGTGTFSVGILRNYSDSNHVSET